jgi:O-antigen/teichoic acid export membrane protein
VFTKLRSLTVNLTVYGVGDVAVQFASFLLLPVYVRVLSPTEYGAVANLLIVEQIMRVIYRWGIDASFMRFYYDCHDTASRQTLASTVFYYLVAVSGGLMVLGIVASPVIGQHLFMRGQFTTALAVVFVTAFLGTLSFLPFHVLRIEGKARTFVALTFTTNISTLLVKLLLVVVLRQGVLGVVLADLYVAIGMLLVLSPRYAAIIRPRFSVAVLRECLRFGLPRLPHGAAHQVTAGADRYVLGQWSQSQLGIYHIGATLGLGMKLFLSAFETAWAPFYFSEMRSPQAKATFRAVTTYAFAVLTLLLAGLASTSRDLVRLMTTPEFYGAAAIVPWIGLSVVLQGVYLLTSIGLNITKRTAYYPVITGAAALAAISMSLLLVPKFGAMGAAWSNVAAYGVMAVVGMGVSQRFYPIPYEWARIARIVIAGVLAIAAGRLIAGPTIAPLAGVLVRGTATLVVFPAALVASGFFRSGEIARARSLIESFRRPKAQVPRPAEAGRRDTEE